VGKSAVAKRHAEEPIGTFFGSEEIKGLLKRRK